MLPEILHPDITPSTRPIVSDVLEDATGRSFTVSFMPRQRLPDHKNSHRIAILAVSGRGVLTIDGIGPREIATGDLVQLDANVVHAVEALDEPLELQVILRPNCCGTC